MSVIGRLTDWKIEPASWSIAAGMPIPTPTTSWSRASSVARVVSCRTMASDDEASVATSTRRVTVPEASTMPAAIFVPPRSIPIAARSSVVVAPTARTLREPRRRRRE